MTEYVVWHCSATSPSQDIGSAQIDIWHKAKGWDGIGYALVIRRDGRLECGEDFKKAGAHAKGYNNKSIGVVLVGGVDEDGKSENNFTALQWAAAKNVYEFFSLLYPGAVHVGHRDLSTDTDHDGRIQKQEFMKDCPCFSVKQWIENDLRPVEEMYSDWELSVAVAVPEVEITMDEILEAEIVEELPPVEEEKPKRRTHKHRHKKND